MDLWEQVERRVPKIPGRLEHLPKEEMLRELRLFSLDKTGLQGELIADFQYLKKAYNEGGDRLLAWPVVTGQE